MFEWQLNQQNRIAFVMVDSNSSEVAGLGAGFTLQLSKNGGAFAGSAGTKAEIGNGWYTYLATVGEADTVGPVAIRVTGAGAVQQNLEYVIKQRPSSAMARNYQVRTSSGVAIAGADIYISTDLAGSSVIWFGKSDAQGYARDYQGDKPILDAGTYYFWVSHPSYTFSVPDTEVFA